MKSPRLTEHARGVYVISATPFRDDGALDLESTGRLMDFCLQHGVHGLTVLGLMGEAPKLAPDEAAAFVDLPLLRYEQQPGSGLAVRKEILEGGMIRRAAGGAGVDG